MDTSRYVDSGADNDSSAEPPVQSIESRRPQHMAFTIHFDDTNKNYTKNINDKISNYALKHRRNQSLPSTEENKTTKGEVNSALAASLSPLTPGKSIATRVAGYHSEGYFSSDQEEDPRNRKGLFVRKLKNLEKGIRTTNLAQEKKNMADQTSRTKLNNSPHMSRHEFGDFPVEDTKLKSRLEELKYLNSGNNATYNPNKDEDAAKDEWLLASTTDNEIEAHPQNNLLDDFDDDNENELSNDTASEAGTYTIDREIPCLEEDLARQEIENEITGMSASSRNVLPDNDFKMSSCRNGSNWINDWATQVAEHNHYQQPEMHISGLPPLPSEKHRASTTLTTRIPSPIHSPILPPSGRRHNPHSPTRPLHLADETESYLRATESVMTAMQARMSLSRDSGSESDVDMPQKVADRGHSLGDRHSVQRQSSGASDGSPHHMFKRVGQSDSGSEASDLKAKREEPPLMKYNRAFSLRRARLDADPVPAPVVDSRKKVEPISNSIFKPKKSMEPSRPNVPFQPRATKSSSPKREPAKTFSRTDCGRFSVRTPKTTPQPLTSAKVAPAIKKDAKKDGKKSGGRSNSTLSSREVEFQNWKRRKSYDPMKAAAEGKKKDAAKKATFNSSMTQSYIAAEELSPSHQSSVLRSASFHGTLGMSGLAPRCLSSEEEATAEEDDDSPTNEYPHPLAPVMGSPAKSACDGAFGGSRASLHSTASNSSLKGRSRPEALDSLVMGALCGLSTKLRGRSCILLKKLRYLYEEDVDKSEQLSAIIDLLEMSGNLDSPQNKSQSKELSETLKNLKRLESVIHVLDEVLFDDEDFDELDAENFQ